MLGTCPSRGKFCVSLHHYGEVGEDSVIATHIIICTRGHAVGKCILCAELVSLHHYGEVGEDSVIATHIILCTREHAVGKCILCTELVTIVGPSLLQHVIDE
jgi:hypothetical protein